MIAAATRMGSDLSESWNACALPWNVPAIEAGTPSCASACWIAVTAWPSATPGARLKLSVTAGNCPWWLIDRNVVGAVVHFTSVLSGTCWPVSGDLMKMRSSACGLFCSSGSTSMIT